MVSSIYETWEGGVSQSTIFLLTLISEQFWDPIAWLRLYTYTHQQCRSSLNVMRWFPCIKMDVLDKEMKNSPIYNSNLKAADIKVWCMQVGGMRFIFEINKRLVNSQMERMHRASWQPQMSRRTSGWLVCGIDISSIPFEWKVFGARLVSYPFNCTSEASLQIQDWLKLAYACHQDKGSGLHLASFGILCPQG